MINVWDENTLKLTLDFPIHKDRAMSFLEESSKKSIEDPTWDKAEKKGMTRPSKNPVQLWDTAVKEGLIRQVYDGRWVWHERLEKWIKTGLWIIDPDVRMFIKIATQIPRSKLEIIDDIGCWGHWPKQDTWTEALEEGLVKRLDKPGVDKYPNQNIWVWHEYFDMYDEKGNKKKKFYDKNMNLVDSESEATFEKVPTQTGNGEFKWVQREIKKE